MYCTVLYCTVLYCTVLYCTVLYCTVLYCVDRWCRVSELDQTVFNCRFLSKLTVCEQTDSLWVNCGQGHSPWQEDREHGGSQGLCLGRNQKNTRRISIPRIPGTSLMPTKATNRIWIRQSLGSKSGLETTKGQKWSTLNYYYFCVLLMYIPWFIYE